MSGLKERRWRRTIDRWGAVLRYHRPEQLARRLWNRVRDRFPIREASVDGPTPKLREAVFEFLLASPERERGESLQESVSIASSSESLLTLGARQLSSAKHLAALRSRKIRLLNREFALDWPPRWDDAEREGMPLLAVFHLHYHEHLLTIVEEEPDVVWAALASWMRRFSIPDRTSAGWSAWHPYCISRRSFAWLKLLRLEPPEAVRTAMIEHLAKQARCLASRFERDIGGNHLWENARALAALGAVFEGEEADGWRRQGLSTLSHCIRDQLSPEGEHFERSPMYQAELAHGLEDLAAVLGPIDAESSERCRATAVRMTEFLDGVRHPDGGLPLLGDTTRDDDLSSGKPEASTTGVRLLCSNRTPVADAPGSPNSNWHGDYFIHQSDQGFLLFDAGDVGPDYLPAHAHSDLLGFEASAFGKRLFIDSGVYSYSGPRREEFRKSAAHNVLTVDGVELADVWGSFRVGRRGHVISRQSGTDGEVQWIRAEHDAYRNIGVRVQRWWILADGGNVWISVHVVLGRGSRTIAERIHLHPEVVWTRNAESVNLQVGDGVLRWATVSPMDFRTETTAYSERFHEERSKTTFVMERRTRLPAVSAWAVAFGGGEFRVAAKIDGSRLIVDWTQHGVERRFERPVEE